MDEAVRALHIDSVGGVPLEDAPGTLRREPWSEGGEQSVRPSSGADEIAARPARGALENVAP